MEHITQIQWQRDSCATRKSYTYGMLLRLILNARYNKSLHTISHFSFTLANFFSFLFSLCFLTSPMFSTCTKYHTRQFVQDHWKKMWNTKMIYNNIIDKASIHFNWWFPSFVYYFLNENRIRIRFNCATHTNSIGCIEETPSIGLNLAAISFITFNLIVYLCVPFTQLCRTNENCFYSSERTEEVGCLE